MASESHGAQSPFPTPDDDINRSPRRARNVGREHECARGTIHGCGLELQVAAGSRNKDGIDGRVAIDRIDEDSLDPGLPLAGRGKGGHIRIATLGGVEIDQLGAIRCGETNRPSSTRVGLSTIERDRDLIAHTGQSMDKDRGGRVIVAVSARTELSSPQTRDAISESGMVPEGALSQRVSPPGRREPCRKGIVSRKRGVLDTYEQGVRDLEPVTIDCRLYGLSRLSRKNRLENERATGPGKRMRVPAQSGFTERANFEHRFGAIASIARVAPARAQRIESGANLKPLVPGNGWRNAGNGDIHLASPRPWEQ